MAKKKEDIVVAEFQSLKSVEPKSIAVAELQDKLDHIIFGGLTKMESIIHSDEVFFRDFGDGKKVLRIVETRDKVAAFNAVINAGKYMESRKRNEAEAPPQLDFSGFTLINGDESQRHGLHQATGAST